MTKGTAEETRHWVRGMGVTACGLKIAHGTSDPWFTTARDPTKGSRATCAACLEVHAKDPTYPVRDRRDVLRTAPARPGRALWTLCRVCGLQVCYHCPACGRQVDLHVRRCPADPEHNTAEAVLAAIMFVEPALAPTCRVFGCREPVACLGRYENDDRSWPSCDVHCGHDDKDGHCELIGGRS